MAGIIISLLIIIIIVGIIIDQDNIVNMGTDLGLDTDKVVTQIARPRVDNQQKYLTKIKE